LLCIINLKVKEMEVEVEEGNLLRMETQPGQPTATNQGNHKNLRQMGWYALLIQNTF
jgi:hypothetical protein